MPRPKLGAKHLLVAAYLLGVVGTLWDWREHYIGVSSQAPHLAIDLGGLAAIGVLAFSDWRRISQRTFVGLYMLLSLVILIALGPFVLMMAAPHSLAMAYLMSSLMTRGTLLLEGPIVLLAGWAAWHWLNRAPVTAWRLGAALAVVLVALATVWDLYWHQTHPLEMGRLDEHDGLPTAPVDPRGISHRPDRLRGRCRPRRAVIGTRGKDLTTSPARSTWKPSSARARSARLRSRPATQLATGEATPCA